MHKNAPNGFFAKDMIIFGELEKGSLVSRGYIVVPPDLNNVSYSQLNEYQEKLSILLSSLAPNQSLQIQWTCNSDYKNELLSYHQETEKSDNPSVRAWRNSRFNKYWEMMLKRELRREQLVVFLCQKLDRFQNPFSAKHEREDFYEKTFGQLETAFQQFSSNLTAILGSGSTVIPMNDLEHFKYYTRFLNPSHADRFDQNYEDLFSSEYSIQELCWQSDGVGLPYGFHLDGSYHSMFSISRWPQKTRPGIIHNLTNLPMLDYQITVNVYPKSVRQEIEKQEQRLERLEGDYRAEKKHSILTGIEKIKSRIDALADGYTMPYEALYAIRVWDATEVGLQSKCQAIKNAVNSMAGASVYESTLPSSAKRLFYCTWPGWTASTYRFRNKNIEHLNLADLLPISSTYVAHLNSAEAIYDGTNSNLVGLKTFVGGSAQHTVLIGMTGAGKSEFMKDILTQTDPYYKYTLIIEEGGSYNEFTKTMGFKPIEIHPDSPLIINYFDTQKLPLSQLHLASASALVARMIGDTPDPEKQQLRVAQLGEYINYLYHDRFNDWKIKNPEILRDVEKEACLIHKWRKNMPTGSTFLDAFTELRDLLKENDEQAKEFESKITAEEITAFTKGHDTERLVMSTACARFNSEDFPTHGELIEALRFNRMPAHDKREIDNIATLLKAWTASGPYGQLFDGYTNIRINDRVTHFELGLIPEQATELKTAAGLLISGFARQHIITLPRKIRKRIIFEEVARFLEVPGGEKIVAESYAQLRKYNCWTISIVQQYSKFKNTKIRPVIMGNSKQFLLMRQFDRSDLLDIASDIQLPNTSINSIQEYPLPEQQPKDRVFSSVCYYSPTTHPPICGTIRHIKPKIETDKSLALTV